MPSLAIYVPESPMPCESPPRITPMTGGKLERVAYADGRIAIRPIVPDPLSLALEGISGLTLRSYQSDWRHFAAWQGQSTPEEALRALVGNGQGFAQRAMYAYRQAMLGTFAPSTVNRRIAALRYVVRATRRAGVIGWTVDVQGVPCKGIRDTRGPGQAAMGAMLAAEHDPRRRLVLLLLHDMALRRAEVVALTMQDVENGDSPRLWIMGKGKHERLPLTMPPRVREAMRVWLEVRGDQPGSLTMASYEQIAGIVDSAARKAQVKPTHAHGLRHAAITRALELTNGNIRLVQRFARHSKPETTALYDDNRTDAYGMIAGMVGNDGKG